MLKRLICVVLSSIACGSVFAATAVTSTDFVPPPDEYDWVQLDSGEWLKGELQSLYDDELVFDSDNLGVLRIDWEDVVRFRGHGLHAVGLGGSEIRVGAVWISGDRLVVSRDDIKYELPREQLVSITRSVARERDRWSGDIAFGINFREGNSDIVEFNSIIGLERRTPASRALLDYFGSINRTDGEEIENNHRVNVAFDRFNDSQWFWRPFIGQYFRDPFQNIQHQATLETGVGYEFVDTSRTEWNFSGGLGFNYLRYDSVETGEDSSNTSPALTLGTDFETEVTDWMDYLLAFQMTFLDDASGAYQHHLLTTLSTDLIGDLDLDVSLVWDRTQKPQTRADGTVPEKDDYRLIFGLAYEF